MADDINVAQAVIQVLVSTDNPELRVAQVPVQVLVKIINPELQIAQAPIQVLVKIINPELRIAQAPIQVLIKPFPQGYALSNAFIIKNWVYAQAEATIQAAYYQYRVSAQAQSSIVVPIFGIKAYGQSRAKILQVLVYTRSGNARALVGIGFGIGNSLAYIKSISTRVHANALSKLIRFGEFKTGQARARILSNTKIRIGQSIALIGHLFHAQAEAVITIPLGFGQADADILVIDTNCYSQAEAWIVTTLNLNLALTEASVLAPDNIVTGQAIASITNALIASGQAESRILAFDFPIFGQANAQIISVYQQFAQAMALRAERRTYWAQAEAYLKKRYRGSGLAQSSIYAEDSKTGLAQARISKTQGYALARTTISNAPSDNSLQHIEEQVNPKTQIFWYRRYRLVPTILYDLPNPYDLPREITANYPTTVGHWIVVDADSILDVYNRLPNDWVWKELSPSFNNSDEIAANAPETNDMQVSNAGSPNYFVDSLGFPPIQGIDKTKTDIYCVRLWATNYVTLGVVDVLWRNPNTGQYEVAVRKGLPNFTYETIYAEAKVNPFTHQPWTWPQLDNLQVAIGTGKEGLPGDHTSSFYFWMEVIVTSQDVVFPDFALSNHASSHELGGSDELLIAPNQISGYEETIGPMFINAVDTTKDTTITGNWTFTQEATFPYIRANRINVNRLRMRPRAVPDTYDIGDFYVDEGSLLATYYTDDGWKSLALEGFYGFSEPIKSHGQALSQLRRYGQPQYGQAAAKIMGVNKKVGQARAKIKYFVGIANAKAFIDRIDIWNRSGQARAFLRFTNKSGQAQAYIGPITYKKFGQARANIVYTSGGISTHIVIGQAMSQILVTNIVYRQNGTNALSIYFAPASYIDNVKTIALSIYASPSTVASSTKITGLQIVFEPTQRQPSTTINGLSLVFNPAGAQTITYINALSLYFDNESFIPVGTYNVSANTEAYLLSGYFRWTWEGHSQAQAHIYNTFTIVGQGMAEIV